MEKTIKYLENGEYHYATVKDVGDLAKLKTDSKDDLVAAINDLFENGGENAGKPEGYDNLVNNVADAIQKQQQISSTIANMQQTAQLSDAEMAHMKQVQEELRQEYLKAIKELNEAVEKAKADAAALDKKTNDMQDKIDETFADVNKEVSDVHKQLDAETKGLRKDLDETKTNLEATRKDLLNSTQEYGQVHSEVKDLQDKFSRRVWSTDLDPVREQVSKNSTEVQQTKDELERKADQSNLDLVTNSVENLNAKVKQNASGLEVAVKRDELGGDVARLLGDKTNLLLGTRSFSGEDNWKNRDTVTIEPGYYKGLKSAAVQVLDGSIYQPYRVKTDTSYTFSFFAREDKDNPKAKLAIKPIDAKNINIDNEEQVVHITTEWQRFAVTFLADKECDVSIQVIQGPEASNNVLHLAGLKLQYGQNDTPWEPNEADVAENIEKNESRFNVFSDQITGIVKKQEKMGDTERQLDTRITETAEGLKQTSKDLQDANGKITEFKGQLESTAHGLKTEYEKYTNDAIGQISDSSLNLIHNSAFSSQDNQFESWQNISAKATVREDSNNLHWVELTQSGQGTDNPIGVTSNYFIVKQGKVTVAVDVKLGDKANLDNQNILLLELYDENRKRVDFTDVSVSQLGLSMSVLNDHNVHRGLYRLGIDRKDVKYMTVKAILHRNGDLWFTNFSARLSSIDDGGYTPNPDDVNHQILKMNTKIEEDAEHIALKANSVDVTKDIKSAVDGIQVGGRNYLRDSDKSIFGWAQDLGTMPNEVLDQLAGKTITVSCDVEWSNYEHDSALQNRLGFELAVSGSDGKGYWLGAWKWPSTPSGKERISAQWSLPAGVTFTVNNNSASGYVSINGTGKVSHVKIEIGNRMTDWTPAPEDTSAEIKSAKDAAIQVASDQINLHVNELSTQFDDRLNKRINEQKTAYEKFTSDGIEQTVKKITDVKNQVDGVNDKVNNLKVGGRNLVRNTDTDIVIDDTGNTGTRGWRFAIIPLTQQPKIGDQITVSAEGTLSGKGNLSTYDVILYNQTFGSARSNSKRLSSGKRASATLQVNNLDGNGDTVLLIYAGNISDTEGKKNTVHHLKVEFGNLATDWTPAPEDINQKIDTQTLDSANIDEMKTQGHYFVKNLTGNPIGGWVYVDVTGNDNDRIRQDVYGDNNTRHMYRRLFGTAWSGWEQGAYLSDVNSLKTEVTASVKNLGDRVTTEVNSITSQVKSNNGGGINLLKGTGSEWKTLTGSVWFCQTTGAGAVELGSFTTGDTVTYSITVRNNSQYAVRPEIVGFSDDNGTRSFNISGTESVQPGETKTVSVSATVAENTVKIIGWLISSGAEPTFSVDAKNEKLERGSVATPWSPAPEDTAEAIKTLNTKWDVANGQIQGKVTSTEVQDLLNRGHYATQEWSQGQIKLTKDQFNVDIKKVTNDLNSRVNEAKTASEKFTSDGIEQTVKKITDVQNNVNNLNKKVDSNNGGGINLQKGTKDCSFQIGTNGSPSSIETYNSDTKMIHTQNGGFYTSYSDSSFVPTPGEFYTISADVKGDGAINGSGFRYEGGNNGTMGNVTLSDTWQRIINTVLVDRVQGQWVIYPSNSKNLYVKHIKIERGTIATPWTPAPEDIEQTIKDATEYKTVTGTIDFNNLKTQQKIFYKDTQATNAPAGGNYWYYLDVEPGYDGRILQTAISDRDNITWIRTFTVNWSPWIRQADKRNVDYLNDQINSFKNETTASVKNLGDRVTTEVNSITSQMNNKINEINTKLDVANGKIEGKVTETQVNNILNGKGYATQSWAQTMFTMKSDAITLQAVRDNITNGIQNQINDTRNQVKGLQNQFNTQTGINLLKGTADFSGSWFNKDANGWSIMSGWQAPTSENKSERNNNVVYQDSGHAWDGLGQTVELDTGEYTFSMWMWPTLSGNESMNIYAGDSQYGGTAKVNFSGYRYSASQPQNRWILVKTYLTVTQGGNLSIRPELNQASGTIYVASYMLQHGHVENPVWAPAPDDLAPKSIISSINITPDQIKIASNKIEIDGNTYIHGDLQAQDVRLVGKRGAMDLSGDKGLLLSNNDGSEVAINENGLGLKYKNDFSMDIDSSLLTLSKRSAALDQPEPIAFGNIGSVMKGHDPKVNGFMLRYNPGSLNDSKKRGATFMSFGYNTPDIGKVVSQIELYGQDTEINVQDSGKTTKRTQRKGIHIQDALEFDTNTSVRFPQAHDHLFLHSEKWDISQQAGYYQPSIRLVSDGGSLGNAGVTFQWDAIKPFGAVDMTDARLWVYGVDHGIKNVWVSWSNWDGGERYPALVNDIGYWGGIAFPKSGRVTLFDADGRYYTPDRNTGIGAYNNYIGKNNNWH